MKSSPRMKPPEAQTETVYRISKRGRTVYICFLVPLIGLCVLGPIRLLIDDVSDGLYWLILFFCTSVAALLGYALHAALVTSLTLLPDRLRYTNGWGRQREWRFEEISGYRTIQLRNSTRMQIVPRDAASKPFQIERSLERSGELEVTLARKFRDLDREDYAAEMNQILTDETFGLSKEQRASALAQARRQARVLNIAVYPLMLWAMIYPRPYECVMVLLALLPTVAVGLVKWSRGMITLEAKKTSPRPNLAQILMIPAMVLVLRAIQDWNILDWSGFLIPFVTLGVGQFVLFWYGSSPESRRKVGTLLIFGLVGLAHSFGLTLFLNCDLDHSVPLMHLAVVQSHRISRGKSTSYYLTVRPWLDGNGAHEIRVGSSAYNQHPEGSRVEIYVRGGTLSMPWFFIH